MPLTLERYLSEIHVYQTSNQNSQVILGSEGLYQNPYSQNPYNHNPYSF